MNTFHNFNPDEKRMQLAALLEDPTQPYKKYSGPRGAPAGSYKDDTGEKLSKIIKAYKPSAPTLGPGMAGIIST